MKYVTTYLILASVLTWGILTMNRRLHPSLSRLETRAVPSGTTDGLAPDPGDVIVPPEMPNGAEAFVVEAPVRFTIDMNTLVMDVDGNFPGSPNYLTGRLPDPPAEETTPADPLSPLWGVAP